MFQLRDSTRRRICLAAFFALCVVPTVVVLAWGVARHVPGHVQAVATRLGWQLGHKVSLGRVRHLRPGAVLYEGFELSDPETGSCILRCRKLKVAEETSKDRKGRPRRCVVLIASGLEVEADRWHDVWQLVRRAVTGHVGSVEADVRLAAGEARLREGESSLTLVQLQGRIDRVPGGSQADLAFRLAEVDTPEPIQIRVARNRRTEPPATGMGIYTGGGELPCPLLGLAVPEFAALGPESRFSGYVWASETPEGWDTEIAGKLTGVDLEGVVAGHPAHSIVGAAEVNVERALFRQGRLREATGSLVAGPGQVSRSLLDAAADRLGMVRGLERGAPRELVPYDRLAASFRIDAHGLQLRGACPPAESGAVLTASFGVLLGEPTLQPVPVAALIQTLAPAGAVQVPATRSTDWLMRRLPVHDPLPPRSAAAPARAAD
jgi:hypothetical protein